ncbi:zf-TFIIB domain-containing protein [Pseudarthrobacter sp. J64]|uniref:TFIIB-type zinc ribbon-containing protein n=1 Tax=Pseudarthrobacter sp. J64 TaxID=3116485 RepID=UPI002E81A8E2|nr:zf-TFIIB domain-containing protein [Pseudarthrobacter sp. J64]MEE2570022.1 zf-TFIIB domain-containing protein [Pseudarthrobacter sp. J64]
MKCPVDSNDLVMSERSGVEIDYCPQCRGVWLDRGELDKILDRAAQLDAGQVSAQPPAAAPAPQPGMAPPPLYPNYEPQRQSRNYNEPRYNEPRYNDRGYDKHGYDQRGYDQYGRRRKKKEGWLGDLFDF